MISHLCAVYDQSSKSVPGISEYAVMERPCRILMNIEFVSMLSWNVHAEYWWTLNQWVCCHGTAMQNIGEHWIREYAVMECPCLILMNIESVSMLSWNGHVEYWWTLNQWVYQHGTAMQNLIYIKSMNTCTLSWHNCAEYLSTLN